MERKNETGGEPFVQNHSKEEQEEDILEMMYLWWRERKKITSADISMNLNIPRRELPSLLKKMEKDGYLCRKDGGTYQELTSLGKALGADCFHRHQNLTQFLQMTCGMDMESAQNVACRMEHVVNKDVIQGICDFIQSGSCYERTTRNINLRMYYEEGSYEFRKGIYLADQRYPRILAEENQAFSHNIRLLSGNARSFFCLKKVTDGYPRKVWYKRESGWREAECENGEYLIPTEIFTFTFDPESFVTEGDSIIAFSADEEGFVNRKNYRELSVHIW